MRPRVLLGGNSPSTRNTLRVNQRTRAISEIDKTRLINFRNRVSSGRGALNKIIPGSKVREMRLEGEAKKVGPSFQKREFPIRQILSKSQNAMSRRRSNAPRIIDKRTADIARLRSLEAQRLRASRAPKSLLSRLLGR